MCKCDCGKEKEFYLSNIIPKPNARYTKSCGCQRKRLVNEKMTIHGLSKTKFYKRWRSMFDRCSPNYICASSYKNIKVCKRWNKFENFYEDMYEKYIIHRKKNGERQTTLDRINPFKGYSKENCRWATFIEQAQTRKNNFKKNYQKIMESSLQNEKR